MSFGCIRVEQTILHKEQEIVTLLCNSYVFNVNILY